MSRVRDSGLGMLSANGVAPIGGLHRFLEMRLRKSSGVDHNSPLMLMLRAVTEGLTWLVEVHIHGAVIRTHTASASRDAMISTLMASDGRYRQHHCAGTRVELLKRVLHTFGSAEGVG